MRHYRHKNVKMPILVIIIGKKWSTGQLPLTLLETCRLEEALIVRVNGENKKKYIYINELSI